MKHTEAEIIAPAEEFGATKEYTGAVVFDSVAGLHEFAARLSAPDAQPAALPAPAYDVEAAMKRCGVYRCIPLDVQKIMRAELLAAAGSKATTAQPVPPAAPAWNIKAAVDALKLGETTLLFALKAAWEGATDDDFLSHSVIRKMSEAIAALEATLAQPAAHEIAALKAAQPEQELVYQYQMANGLWVDQAKASYDYNVKQGKAVVRVLYASPQALQPVPPAPTKLSMSAMPEFQRYRISLEGDCLIAHKDGGVVRLSDVQAAWPHPVQPASHNISTPEQAP